MLSCEYQPKSKAIDNKSNENSNDSIVCNRNWQDYKVTLDEKIIGDWYEVRDERYYKMSEFPDLSIGRTTTGKGLSFKYLDGTKQEFNVERTYEYVYKTSGNELRLYAIFTYPQSTNSEVSEKMSVKVELDDNENMIVSTFSLFSFDSIGNEMTDDELSEYFTQNGSVKYYKRKLQ
ncbi:hypothetical protein CMU66_13900 [Elizabethkingia anophelis]|nr:hypothetical protein [Elizabethkingia anophelis]MDV3564940.1 hypothetical protein [Elizabethkingia anophelis]MDV3623447.1 hypothetical protein [Elizabethkingia anophelis]MDV3643294.1 hypothetical protein [Elizabethkingia anophelis]MDV3657916.1 hypothetical protein [Elizabethkingia anophelis]